MTDQEIDNRVSNAPDLKGTTVNERLVLTGLIEEFDRSIKSDKRNAKNILEALKVDPESITLILRFSDPWVGVSALPLLWRGRNCLFAVPGEVK